MKEVKNMTISDGITYTGEVESDGYMDVPHGMGICKYGDHNETGRFQDGELNGMAYLNYHDWMSVGLVQNGVINGWGLKVNRGKIEFGIYKDSILRVDLTPLVEIFWNKILEDASIMNRNAISVKKTGNILVGVPQTLTQGQFGFNFLSNGEVFLGINDYDEKGITGKFLHFDLNYNITKGIFHEGVFVQEVDDTDFVGACQVWVSHAYMDFDINMNFAPSSFLFDVWKMVHIFEIGSTDSNILVKAAMFEINENNEAACDPEDEDSVVWFMFPKNNDVIYDELNELAEWEEREEHPWVPNFNDYCVVFINNLEESGSDHLVVYKHKSCWEEDANFELDHFDNVDALDLGMDLSNSELADNNNEDYFGPKALGLIPGYSVKRTQLESQWRNNGWYYTYPALRDYVESLAEEDDVENFFGWLFDDPQFNGIEAWKLPSNYREAYFQFLNLFPSLD